MHTVEIKGASYLVDLSDAACEKCIFAGNCSAKGFECHLQPLEYFHSKVSKDEITLTDIANKLDIIISLLKSNKIHST